MPCPLPPEELAKVLEPYRWEKRVVLMCYASAESAEAAKQRSIFAKEKAGVAERDILIIEREGKRFEVRLYGKDGGEKLRKERVVPAEELFGLIDQMPMRREEIRRKPI
jgi:hypothetical protein